MKTTLGATIVAALCLSIFSPALGIQIGYSVTEIQSVAAPSGQPMSVLGLGLNDKGQVAGYMYSRAGFPQNAFVTGPNGSGLHLLGNLPGTTSSYATGVNNSGQVTGTSLFGRRPAHSFLSDPNGGALHAIGSLGPRTDTLAFAVNNHGQVTGLSALTQPLPPPQTTVQHAFLTGANGGALIDLGTLGGTFSWGTDVNDEGQVAGISFLAGDAFPHAFLSEPNGGPLHDLGTFGGKQSSANGLNEAGQVAGWADLRGRRGTHAFLSGPDGGALLDLGTLGGTFSSASGVNDLGVIVGDSLLPGNSAFHAFVYFPGVGIEDLNGLIDPALGIELTNAGEINERGQILAGGVVDGRQVSFLLTPISGVPDSGSTGLLLGCALAGLLFTGRMVRPLPQRLHCRPVLG